MGCYLGRFFGCFFARRLGFHGFGVHFACSNGLLALLGEPEGAPEASGASPGSPGLLRQIPPEGPRSPQGVPGDGVGRIWGAILGHVGRLDAGSAIFRKSCPHCSKSMVFAVQRGRWEAMFFRHRTRGRPKAAAGMHFGSPESSDDVALGPPGGPRGPFGMRF